MNESIEANMGRILAHRPSALQPPTRRLSLVIPAYNQEARIGASLETILRDVHAGSLLEVIVVDDGSTDQTSAIVAEWAARGQPIRLIRLPVNQGKGAAVRHGMLQAKGQSVCYCDADLPVPLAVIEQMSVRLEQGHDLIIASRGLRGTGAATREGWMRRRIGQAFNWCVRRMFGLIFTDTQCGVKCFRRAAAQAIFSRSRINGFAFDVEVLLLAQRLGLTIGEHPVHIIHTGSSTVSLINQVLPVVADLRHIARNLRCGVYARPPHFPPAEPVRPPRPALRSRPDGDCSAGPSGPVHTRTDA